MIILNHGKAMLTTLEQNSNGPPTLNGVVLRLTAVLLNDGQHIERLHELKAMGKSSHCRLALSEEQFRCG
ncbi:hypothetical protein AVEN_14144-1 [Araneus ventricosus]|uniref:Uncharacterized protein n=1 Tax=Araneus ventricosus TaxID=182803 RepID=A0A4Y2FW43_ARAVE|nr:hypothetical protein AVEN_14144-1 [Araneus ventricosus]